MQSSIDTRTHLFVGRTYEVRYPELTATNAYSSDGKTMNYEITEGTGKGAKGSVSYASVELSNGVYAISWQEDDRATVVHIDDFDRGTSLSFYTTPANDLYRLAGTLTVVE